MQNKTIIMSKIRFHALKELSNRQPLEVTTPSDKLSDYFGCDVFNRKRMQEYLPKEAFNAVMEAIDKGSPISRSMADLIANGMKSWAKSRNATHYTHWFQPLTDEHDGFIEFGTDSCDVIERFSGKLLAQQKTDASLFSNGDISIRETVKPYLDKIRDHIDHLEMEIDDEIWPLPKYRELLFTK